MSFDSFKPPRTWLNGNVDPIVVWLHICIALIVTIVMVYHAYETHQFARTRINQLMATLISSIRRDWDIRFRSHRSSFFFNRIRLIVIERPCVFLSLRCVIVVVDFVHRVENTGQANIFLILPPRNHIIIIIYWMLLFSILRRTKQRRAIARCTRYGSKIFLGQSIKPIHWYQYVFVYRFSLHARSSKYTILKIIHFFAVKQSLVRHFSAIQNDGQQSLSVSNDHITFTVNYQRFVAAKNESSFSYLQSPFVSHKFAHI